MILLNRYLTRAGTRTVPEMIIETCPIPPIEGCKTETKNSSNLFVEALRDGSGGIWSVNLFLKIIKI
ncbi:MAG: hypothetical protein UW42_C0010G0005 [Candidatus Collierbacteria bacterium GW2011_GWB1_44_197]|nr:MAG: hypothetical protein UW42_C0010G0005 [Candidatus Collierbacteria bacterium GW2011_GWB1_44_197]